MSLITECHCVGVTTTVRTYADVPITLMHECQLCNSTQGISRLCTNLLMNLQKSSPVYSKKSLNNLHTEV